MVAPMYREATVALANSANVVQIEAAYDAQFLEGKHLVIATTDIPEVNEEVYWDCKQRNLLVNVADNPPYCDFYMGGIVTKGNVKVAISTNGKSPTTAKRLRQFFEAILPEDINKLVQNLNTYRNTIQGNFAKKVQTLNKLTESLAKN